MKLTSVPFLLAPVLPASALAQTNSVELARVGDTAPTGDLATGFTHLRVNNDGAWAVIVHTDNPNPDSNAVLMKDGDPILAEGAPAPDTAAQDVVELRDCDLNDNGYLAVVAELTGGFAVYYRGEIVVHEGDPAVMAGLGAGSTYVNVFKVNVNDTDQLLLRCRIDDPTLPVTVTDCLVRLEIGAGGAILSSTLLGRTGDLFPAQSDPLLLFEQGDNSVSFLDDATGTWAGQLVPGAAPGEHVLYYNATTPLYQGNRPAPIAGRTWLDQPIRATAASLSGSEAYSARLDASNTANDEVIVLDQAIFVREGAPLPGVPGSPSIRSLGYQKLFLTGGGVPIFFAEFGIVGPQDEAILRGNSVLLRKGDMVCGGAIITDMEDVEHAFHASENGNFLLSKVQLDAGPKGLIYTQVMMGSPYCSAEFNSTGNRAETVAFGVSLTSANCFGLRTTDAPPGQFAYYLTSMNKGNVLYPGGSQGRLCLANPIARFVAGVGPISPGGTFTRTIDLTAIPSSPPTSVVAGETWHFQAWFRDVNPGATSNFSRPVSVTFR